MAFTLYESDEKKEKSRTGIVMGVVVNNCDLIMQGKVAVRIPSLNQEVWARLAAPGAGSGVGFFSVPPPDAEVLVALNQDEPEDAFIVGGLWSTLDRPPIGLPTDMQTKRIIKTGLGGAAGHEVEFDDALQSVSITTSTQQKITLDPEKIELSTTLGNVKITLDLTRQSISIQALAPPPLGTIELKATTIKLQAANVEIDGKIETKIKGGVVNINPVV